MRVCLDSHHGVPCVSENDDGCPGCAADCNPAQLFDGQCQHCNDGIDYVSGAAWASNARLVPLSCSASPTGLHQPIDFASRRNPERLGLDIDTRDHPAGSYYEPDPHYPGYWRFVGPDSVVWGDYITEEAMQKMLVEERAVMAEGEQIEDDR